MGLKENTRPANEKKAMRPHANLIAEKTAQLAG
jgi:hypothetical protein